MFKDRIAPKNQKPADKHPEGNKFPWGFKCPQYDERTSCFIDAGTNYGIGFSQPIGHEGNPKSEGVPMGIKRKNPNEKV